VSVKQMSPPAWFSTALVIAHRLSTAVHADEIIVLDGGVVAEHGSHGELLRKRGNTPRSGKLSKRVPPQPGPECPESWTQTRNNTRSSFQSPVNIHAVLPSSHGSQAPHSVRKRTR
jgi:ABC-type multidrug transport system ATPase subunit